MSSEITRKTEIIVETKRRFIIAQAANPEEQIFCPQCAALMIAAEHCAALLGVSRREIYRSVENGTAHFAETETGALLVCPAALPAPDADAEEEKAMASADLKMLRADDSANEEA